VTLVLPRITPLWGRLSRVLAHFPDLEAKFAKNASKLNGAVGGDQVFLAALENWSQQNQFGLFRAQYKPKKGSSMVFCYMAYDAKTPQSVLDQALKAKGGGGWWDDIKEKQNVARGANAQPVATTPSRRRDATANWNMAATWMVIGRMSIWWFSWRIALTLFALFTVTSMTSLSFLITRVVTIASVTMGWIFEEGWVGKPKGMRQILWERGFIDATKISQYKNNAHDKFGISDPERNLSYMMQELYDFAHEKSLLQFHGEGLGVTIDRTPKCHPEMAGEGIEYSWGCAKNHYRALKTKDKKSKENFRKNVKTCAGRNLVTVELVRKFSRRARRYMVAYYKLAHGLAVELMAKENRLVVAASRSHQ